MEKKLIKCSRIGVDCVANDPVDIRCGGPEYLGFDFNVREEETEDMIQDKRSIKEYEDPFKGC